MIPKTKIEGNWKFILECRAAFVEGRDFDRARVEDIHRSLLKQKKNLPGDAGLRNSIGITACLLGQAEESYTHHRSAITLASMNPIFHFNLAVSMSILNVHLGEAEASIKKAIELSPGDSTYHDQYIYLLQKQGRIDEALAYAKEVQKRFPKDEDFQDIIEVLEDWESVEIAKERSKTPRSEFIPHQEFMKNVGL